MFDTDKIERARIIKGLTKGDLARKIGIHPNSYTRIIKGQTENPKTVKAICDELDLRMEDVYIGDEEHSAA